MSKNQFDDFLAELSETKDSISKLKAEIMLESDPKAKASKEQELNKLELRFHWINLNIQGMDVSVGSKWHHYNGAEYTVTAIANAQGDDPSKRDKYPPTVVYQGENGKIWARPLSDWHRSMTKIS